MPKNTYPTTVSACSMPMGVLIVTSFPWVAYGDQAAGLDIALEDFIGSDTKPDILLMLEKEFEPTLVVIPDIIASGKLTHAYHVHAKVLAHCAKTQSRSSGPSIPRSNLLPILPTVS